MAIYDGTRDKQWSSTAEQYAKVIEHDTGYASEQLFKESSKRLSYDPNLTPGARILDDGCGSGGCTSIFRRHAPKTPVLAADISPVMLEKLSGKALPDVRTKVADALDLTTLGADGQDETYTHVVSTFMIQFTSDTSKCVREMHRVLKPGGILSLATWNDHDLVDSYNRNGKALDNEWSPTPLWSEDWPKDVASIQSHVEGLGFTDVKVWLFRMDWSVTNDVMIDYYFDGGNPAVSKTLVHWKEKGLAEALKGKIYEEYVGPRKPRLGCDAYLVVGCKV